jgi:hypothetical protein
LDDWKLELRKVPGVFGKVVWPVCGFMTLTVLALSGVLYEVTS